MNSQEHTNELDGQNSLPAIGLRLLQVTLSSVQVDEIFELQGTDGSENQSSLILHRMFQ